MTTERASPFNTDYKIDYRKPGVDMTQNHIEASPGGGTSFVGPDAVKVYQATVIGSALRLYAKCGLKVNRAYTPSAMMKVATALTGKTFKARDYLGAADALKAWAEAQALAIHAHNASLPR